jgi:hypothetical protein
MEGYVQLVCAIWLSNQWRDLWNELGLTVERFVTLQLALDSPDAVVWRTCQRAKLVLNTGNRNADAPGSLEVVIREESRLDGLPVVTLANPQRIARHRVYAETVAERLLEKLIAIDDFRGAGRIYVHEAVRVSK